MSSATDYQDALPAQLRQVRALCFDVIGTCFDWHTPVHACLQAHGKQAGLEHIDWSNFAHLWRGTFFRFVKDLTGRNEVAAIADVFRQTLQNVMREHKISEDLWDVTIQDDLIRSWAMMEPWADTVNGMKCLRDKLVIVALSNGSTMSTISVSRRTGVEWDLLLNSNITGVFKPHPKAYQFALTALDAVKSPEQVAMVAAHAYDLEAAKTHGMKTIYIKRPTEDMDVDVSKQSFDLLIEEGGLGELARRLGCLL